MKRLILSILIASSFASADGYETIKEKSYGDRWAFTVSEVKIGCEMGLPVVFIRGDNSAYGLTGFSAKAVGRGIDSIWGDNPMLKGLKIDISPFINLALSHCSK